jgi:hypothetical protein
MSLMMSNGKVQIESILLMRSIKLKTSTVSTTEEKSFSLFPFHSSNAVGTFFSINT